MQPVSSYADTNDKLRLVLQGNSGVGKTTLACQFPGAYIIDIDVNLGGSLRYIEAQNKKGANLRLPVGYDNLDKDEKGNLIALPERYQRLNVLLQEAQNNPLIETIVLDSGTILVDVMMNEIFKQQKKTSINDWKDPRQFWNLFIPFCRNFFDVLTRMRKHIVIPLHEKFKETPEGFVVYPVQVSWPGQIGRQIGIWFTNIWRAEVEQTAAGVNTTNYKWQIRTMPDSKYALKNTLMLPPVFEFKWETIEKALKGESK